MTDNPLLTQPVQTSEEYKRGYDAGYKQALRDALKDQRALGISLQGRELKPLARPQPSVKFGGRESWKI